MDGKINVTAFYSRDLDKDHHVVFTMWNLITSSILQHLEKDSVDKHQMSVSVEPMPGDGADFFEETALQSLLILFLFSLSFTTVFLILPIKERSSKVKLVQYIAGVSPLLYWMTNLLWDLAIFTIAFTIFTLVLVVDDSMGFYTGNVIFPYILLLVSFGVAVIPASWNQRML